jgi:broad specificity phosphatase PhoE
VPVDRQKVLFDIDAVSASTQSAALSTAINFAAPVADPVVFSVESQIIDRLRAELRLKDQIISELKVKGKEETVEKECYMDVVMQLNDIIEEMGTRHTNEIAVQSQDHAAIVSKL